MKITNGRVEAGVYHKGKAAMKEIIWNQQTIFDSIIKSIIIYSSDVSAIKLINVLIGREIYCRRNAAGAFKMESFINKMII